MIIPDLISLGRKEEAITYCEKACDYMEKFYALPEKYTYTSPLVRGSVCNKKWETADDRPEARIVYENYICRDCYDALKDEPRFKAVIDRIKKLF